MRGEYEAVVYFHSENDAEAEALYDSMVLAIGCSDGDHVCPHFMVGFLRPATPRGRAIRWLWWAVQDTVRVMIKRGH